MTALPMAWLNRVRAGTRVPIFGSLMEWEILGQGCSNCPNLNTVEMCWLWLLWLSSCILNTGDWVVAGSVVGGVDHKRTQAIHQSLLLLWSFPFFSFFLN